MLVVGDVPEKEAEWAADPLVGNSSKQFARLLQRAGYERDAFRFANVLYCRPNDGKLSGEWYENKAVSACHPNLETEISNMQPKVVIALGNSALKRLTGYEGIWRYRGRPLPLLGHPGVWVVPTLHPQQLLPGKGEDSDTRNPARFTGAVILDIKKAFHIKDHGFERVNGNYLLDPTPEEFLGYILEYENRLRNPEAFGATFLSWDIETPWKMKNQDEGEMDLKESSEDTDAPIRYSFAFQIRTGVSIPADARYLEGVRRLLASQGPKVTWNGWHFDEPKVRATQVQTINGVSHDGMWAWHLYQPDLDNGLEFVTSFSSDLLPWKHLNQSDPVLYSAIDPDAALQNFLYTIRNLQKHGQFDLYTRHIVNMEPIWQKAGGAGVLVDAAKQNELREKLQRLSEEITAEVQSLVPEAVKPRKRYKKKPFKDDIPHNPGSVLTRVETDDGRIFIPVTAIAKVKRCSHCGLEGVTKGKHFKGGKKNPCVAAGAQIEDHLGEVWQWDELLPFNPGSSDQKKALIRFNKHPLGRDVKDRNKVTVDAKHIKKLIKAHGDQFPIYAKLLAYSKIAKTKSTYLPPPDEHRKIYTVYTNTPATHRTSSKAPSKHGTNMQNWGKNDENKWAKLARETIIAKPGHSFVAADSKAVEALMTGWFMNDLDFMMLSSKGVYAWLLAKAHGVEVSGRDFTVELGEHYKSTDKRGYRRKKVTTLGTLYGMGPGVLAETYPEDFSSRKDAESEQEFLFNVLPSLKAFQDEVKQKAHKETFLISPWGYRRYFYDVFVWRNYQGIWRRVEGPGADKAVAFKPQNSNGAFQRDNILMLHETWLRDFYISPLFVHDSLMYEVPDERIEEAAQLLESVMTRPIPEMNGLRCGIEIEVGKSWGDYRKPSEEDPIGNPNGMRLLRAVLVEPTPEMLPGAALAA